MFKHNLIVVTILALATGVFGAEMLSEAGYGGSTVPDTSVYRDDLLDPTDGTAENAITWNAGYTSAWPSFSSSFANYFDIADYGVTGPVAVLEVEIGCTSWWGYTLSSDQFDVFVVPWGGSQPDESTVLGEYSGVCTDLDVGSWPTINWNPFDLAPAGRDAIMVDDEFVAGIHQHWTDGQYDFGVGMDYSSAPIIWFYVYTGIWQSGVAYGGYSGAMFVRVTVGPGIIDETDPTITNIYPFDEDYPSGIPPDENFAGCHWEDGDPETNLGIDVGASSFTVYDASMDLVTGILVIDDADLFDVIVDFEGDDPWDEGATYTVETETFDLAGNSASELWTFDTGYTTITDSSFGAIKAGFAQ